MTTLVSQSNHKVSREGGWFTKVPRSGEEHCLLLEHSANRVLGRESRLDANGVLHTACVGEPVSDPDGEKMMVDGMSFAALASREVDRVFLSRKPRFHMSEKELFARLVSKMGDHPDVVAWSIPHLNAVKVDSGAPLGLNHPDPHPGNWVVSDDGGLALIDWEWPVWGSAAVGRGCLLSTLLFSRDVPRSSVDSFASRLDDVALGWFRGKVVASVGWSYRRFGIDGATKRMAAVDDFWDSFVSPRG